MLGIAPVLPLFSGSIPCPLSSLYPNASIVNGGQQSGSPSTLARVSFLEPFHPLFTFACMMRSTVRRIGMCRAYMRSTSTTRTVRVAATPWTLRCHRVAMRRAMFPNNEIQTYHHATFASLACIQLCPLLAVFHNDPARRTESVHDTASSSISWNCTSPTARVPSCGVRDSHRYLRPDSPPVLH